MGGNPQFFFWLALLTYVLVVSLLHARRIARFMNGFDLAFYQQAIWNTAQGRFLAVSATDFSSSLLGTDVILIYALLAPFYALAPTTLTLLVLETVVVALGALPVYWLARERLGSGWAGLGFALVYLLLPAVQNGNLYELRERIMGGSFLLFAFYFWHKERLGWFGVFAALALACRPENGLVLIMLGLYGWLEKRHKQPGRGWRFIWLPPVLGAVWFGLALLIIQLAAGGRGFALGSTFAGGSPLAAITTLFTNPTLGWQQLFPNDAALLGKFLYVPLLLLPFAFLPLLSPRLLLLALPSVGLNLLAGERRDLQWNPFAYHYQASVMPWLLLATIFAVAKLKDNPPRWLTFPAHKVALGVVLALTLSLNIGLNVLTYNVPGVPQAAHGWGRILRAKEDGRWAGGYALLQKVPDDAPLAVTNLWSPVARPRRGLWLLAERSLYSLHPAQTAQYVLADMRLKEDAAIVAKLRASGEWDELEQQSEYLLLQRKATP